MYSPSLRRRLFPLAYCSSGMARDPLSTVQRVLIAVFSLASASSGSTFFRYRSKQTRRRAPRFFNTVFCCYFFLFESCPTRDISCFTKKEITFFSLPPFSIFRFFPGENYSEIPANSGSIMMRPQYSQTMIFLPILISICFWGGILLKHPPQAPR